jgi:hypothetical protein
MPGEEELRKRRETDNARRGERRKKYAYRATKT